MLGHDGAVVVACNNLELALQVASLADEAGFGVAIRVLLWGVHIALTVHHLIEMPVDDGTSGHTHLEHVGVVGHQRNGHVTAIAPSVNADSVGVNIRQRFQVFHAFHLVLHLHLS